MGSSNDDWSNVDWAEFALDYRNELSDINAMMPPSQFNHPYPSLETYTSAQAVDPALLSLPALPNAPQLTQAPRGVLASTEMAQVQRLRWRGHTDIASHVEPTQHSTRAPPLTSAHRTNQSESSHQSFYLSGSQGHLKSELQDPNGASTASGLGITQDEDHPAVDLLHDTYSILTNYDNIRAFETSYGATGRDFPMQTASSTAPYSSQPYYFHKLADEGPEDSDGSMYVSTTDSVYGGAATFSRSSEAMLVATTGKHQQPSSFGQSKRSINSAPRPPREIQTSRPQSTATTTDGFHIVGSKPKTHAEAEVEDEIEVEDAPPATVMPQSRQKTRSVGKLNHSLAIQPQQAMLTGQELLDGRIDPGKICGAVILHIAKSQSNEQIAAAINAMLAKGGKGSITKNLITKRISAALQAVYPDPVARLAARRQLNAVRTKVGIRSCGIEDFSSITKQRKASMRGSKKEKAKHLGEKSPAEIDENDKDEGGRRGKSAKRTASVADLDSGNTTSATSQSSGHRDGRLKRAKVERPSNFPREIQEEGREMPAHREGGGAW